MVVESSDIIEDQKTNSLGEQESVYLIRGKAAVKVV